jgi:adenosylhomocysteinase
MDLAFGIEALALAWLALATRPANPPGNLAPGNLAPGVHEVPEDIDAEAARLVLATMGTSIDTLTPAQLSYRESWRIGS